MPQSYKEFFKGKKITVMGLGLLGRGLGDTKFLAENGADLIVTDLRSEEELSESLSQLGKYENIKFRLGGHDIEDFENRDMIIKAAGVSLQSPFIEHAKNNNIPVEEFKIIVIHTSIIFTMSLFNPMISRNQRIQYCTDDKIGNI